MQSARLPVDNCCLALVHSICPTIEMSKEYFGSPYISLSDSNYILTCCAQEEEGGRVGESSFATFKLDIG